MTSHEVQGSAETSHAGPSGTGWRLPAKIVARDVIPQSDEYTRSSSVGDTMKGKESDPSSLSVYLCLLDDRPHLHPSLGALHKHRHNAHGIPFPPNPSTDLPLPSASSLSSILNKSQTSSVQPDSASAEGKSDEANRSPIKTFNSSGDGVEWLLWKFTDEEETRRKAYLPL